MGNILGVTHGSLNDRYSSNNKKLILMLFSYTTVSLKTEYKNSSTSTKTVKLIVFKITFPPASYDTNLKFVYI